MNAGPYFFFFNQCAEAMKLYQKVLGGELHVMSYKDLPDGKCPPGMENNVLHAALKKGDLLLMASDAHPDMTPPQGLNAQVQAILNCDSAAEVDRIYAALNGGEKIHDEPPHDSFWGARFATCQDRFGICWMFNYEYPKK